MVKNLNKMEGPNSKPHHVLMEELVEEQLELFHWNWDVRAAAGRTALARRYLRYKPRGLEAKRRLNGSMLSAMTGYYVKSVMEAQTFKMYKQIGKKKEKKNKVLQITQ